MLVAVALNRISFVAAQDSGICRETVTLSANARTLGSYKTDEFKSHTHTLSNTAAYVETSGGNNSGSSANSTGSGVGSATLNTAGAAETAPRNVALYPRIRI